MEEPHTQPRQLVKTSKRFARRLLTIGENRLELLMVEVQEALGVAALGLLTGIALTGAIVVLLWEISRAGALLALTGIYGATAVCLYRRLTRLLRNWESFPATVKQLQKDRACLEKHLA